VARKLIESYLEHGDPLPEVVTQAMVQPQPPFNVQIAVSVVV